MTSKPSCTNCPNAFELIVRFELSAAVMARGFVRRSQLYVPIHVTPLQVIVQEFKKFKGSRAQEFKKLQTFNLKRHSGGYSGGVPPLPIPNREVKPACADGTAHPWESR